MPLNERTSYEEKLAAFLAEERRIQSAGGSPDRFTEERIQLGLDVLRGRMGEADALERLDEIDEECRPLRLYHPQSVRQAVEEVRAEKEAYASSKEGIEERRAGDEARLAGYESVQERVARLGRERRTREDKQKRIEQEDHDREAKAAYERDRRANLGTRGL